MKATTQVEAELNGMAAAGVGGGAGSKVPQEPVPFEIRIVQGLLRLLREQGVVVTSVPSDGLMLNDWAYLIRRLASETGWQPAEIDARLGVREGVTAKVLGPGPVNGKPVAEKPIAHVIAEAECRGNEDSAMVFPATDSRSGRNVPEEFIGDSLMYLGRAIKAGGYCRP